MDITSFHVWYKLKAADQHLLNRLKDKRMTGFRLSWKIERPTLNANISELGRSIETPGFGQQLDKHAKESEGYMSHSQMLGKFEYTLPAKF